MGREQTALKAHRACICAQRRALPRFDAFASLKRLPCAAPATIPTPDDAHTGPERLEMARLTQNGDQTSHRPDPVCGTSYDVMKRRMPMRGALSILFIFIGSAAMAHPGHWADAAGHDHWVAGVAIGLAGLAAIWGALKGKKEKDAAEAEEELEEETA